MTGLLGHSKVLTNIDIANRWGVSKQVVTNVASRHDDFPKPIAIVANGKTKLYTLEDIQIYEKKHNRKVVTSSD